MKIKPNIKFQNQCYQRGTFQNNQLLGNQSKSIIFLTTDIDCNQYSILRVVLYIQAVDRAKDARELTAQETAASLKVASMSTTGYLMGMVPLFLGMEVRISAILKTPLLCRELPCIVKRIDLHPKEPRLRHSMKAHILQYMPLGVVVEVTDPEYAQFCVPDSGLPPGHFYLTTDIQ